MKLAMLARNPKLYSHQRLVEAAEERGHTIDIINTLRVNISIASHRPALYYQDEKLGGYDAVIPRIGASITFYGLAVVEAPMRGITASGPPSPSMAWRWCASLRPWGCGR